MLNPLPYAFGLAAFLAPDASPTHVRALGVRLNVLDMRVAVDFYSTKLGFVIRAGGPTSLDVDLAVESGRRLTLHQVPNLPPLSPTEARASLTLQVRDLDAALSRLRSAGVLLGEVAKRKEGVGIAATIHDPFGTPLSLMQQTVAPIEEFTEPAIYNFGFYVPDMARARAFHETSLGFVARSERYLPFDMPLGHADGTFGFMLHVREGVEAMRYKSVDDERVVILFEVSDLAGTVERLKARGVVFQQAPQTAPGATPVARFYDPFGYISEIVERR